jgi:hypothetical protein
MQRSVVLVPPVRYDLVRLSTPHCNYQPTTWPVDQSESWFHQRMPLALDEYLLLCILLSDISTKKPVTGLSYLVIYVV